MNAIGVLIGWWENRDSPLDESNLAGSKEVAEEKTEKAYQTTYVETASQALREQLDNESPVWVGWETHRELSERKEQGESLNQVIQGLLAETTEVKPLNDLLENLIENKPVTDIQASKDLLIPQPDTPFVATKQNPATLNLNVSVPGGEHGDHELSGEIESETLFEFGGYYFDVDLIPAAAPGGLLNSIQIFAAEDIVGMDPVPLDEGLISLLSTIQEETEN
jgi:hypothetical protein